jgi:hypothetical protein
VRFVGGFLAGVAVTVAAVAATIWRTLTLDD